MQPDNLPTKRIWSKKYPIRIQASTRKPFSTEEATQKMAAHDDIPDEAESKANDTDEDEMLDAKEHLDEDLGKKIEIFITFFKPHFSANFGYTVCH